MKSKLLLSAILVFSFSAIQAQRIFQDTTFSKKDYPNVPKGIKLLKLSNLEVRSAAVSSLGKIVTAVAGYNTNSFYVFRLNPDGTPDSTFGNNGGDSVLITSSTIVRLNSLLVQPDGKILIAGYRQSTSGDPDMVVMRLNTDGARDTDFGIAGIWQKDFNGGADSIYKIALQKSGAIILAGTSDTLGVQGLPYARMTVLRLSPNGKEDKTIFHGYISPANTYGNENVTGLDILNDTIYVGANCQVGNYLYNSIVKLLPNGKPAWTSASSGGRIDLTAGSDIKDLAVRRNGDIFIMGNDYSYDLMYLTKINSKGISSTPFIFAQYGIPLKSMLIDTDGDIILNGNITNNYIYSVKCDENGEVDSTFGVSGHLQTYGISNGYSVFNQAIFSKDRKLLFIGQDVKTSLPSITKVYTKPVMNILGKTIVLPKDVQDYGADVPAGWSGYTYAWTYSGKNVLYFSALAGPKISIFFTDSATSGILSCKVYNGSSLVSYDQKEILINPKVSNAYQLATPICKVPVTDCGIGYIDYFNLNSISNDGSGCSEGGYSDYTRSTFNDTLSAGGVYSAHIRIPGNGIQYNYAGIWIDYNNDGDFNNSDEFVGEGYSSGDEVNVNNIILKNKEGYTGAKRLRVRSQPDVSFTSSSSCPARGEVGETEDYLIMITTQPVLEAPQIITPNDDGLNDYFVVRGINPLKSNKLTIFDRVGTLKFTTSAYENNWNGTDSTGDKLIQGTYYYVFTSDKETIKGFVEVRY